MAAHTALGFLLAVGLTGAIHGAALGSGLLGLAIWVGFLNGGTLALNSAFDKDEGDIGYLRRPPPPPAGLAGFSLGLLVIGQAASFLLPLPFAWAYAACFLLSILYSVPPFRLKAVAGPDWLINMWGFGTLTPYAGWASSGLPLTQSGFLVLLAFCPLFAALYPLTQLYQFEQDRKRGDRTLALRLGMRISLNVAIGGTLVAFGFFGWGGAAAGWGSEGQDLLRWAGIAVAWVAWLVVLLPWRRRYREMTPDQHQRGMYRGLVAWAVTDLVILLAFGL
jgi:4-hydroxybenzoate polyprenyltransferase